MIKYKRVKGGGRGVLIKEQQRLTEENKGHNENNDASQYQANILLLGYMR